MNFDFLAGWKTYIAAVGLCGLAVYQLTQGQVVDCVQTFFAALAAFGLKSSMNRNQLEMIGQQKAMIARQELLLRHQTADNH